MRAGDHLEMALSLRHAEVIGHSQVRGQSHSHTHSCTPRMDSDRLAAKRLGVCAVDCIYGCVVFATETEHASVVWAFCAGWLLIVLGSL